MLNFGGKIPKKVAQKFLPEKVELRKRKEVNVKGRRS